MSNKKFVSGKFNIIMKKLVFWRTGLIGFTSILTTALLLYLLASINKNFVDGAENYGNRRDDRGKTYKLAVVRNLKYPVSSTTMEFKKKKEEKYATRKRFFSGL